MSTALVLGVLALSLAGCGEGEAAATSRLNSDSELATPVETVAVARHSVNRTIEIAATVLPLRTVGIVGQVPGKIRSISVDVGDRVVEKQVLVKLDQRDYLLALRQARAQLEAAQASTNLAAIGVKAAKTQYSRIEVLRRSEAVAEVELDKVDDGYRAGLAKQAAAKANTDLAQVGLDAARAKLDDTIIRAPFTGIILERGLDEGAAYHPSSPRPLLVLAEDRRVRVEGSVGERDLGIIRTGMAATVSIESLPEEERQGTVEIVSPMVDPRTRTAKIRVSLDNPEGRLGTGMSGQIVLELGSEQVLAVPDDTVRRLGTGARAEVFVVDEGIARRLEVTIGDRQDDLVEVVDGLDESQLVIRSGHATLDDGDPVTTADSRGTSE